MAVSPGAFDPALDPEAFRRALGRFGTGVTVVTTLSARGPVGITANSFASLSLNPPLVLWSPARSSTRHDAFVAAAHFAIHVLSAAQEDVCRHFTRAGGNWDRIAHEIGAHGLPLISGCAAVFECTREAIHNGGDHTLVIGRVSRARYTDGDTLMFVNGRIGSSLAFSAETGRT